MRRDISLQERGEGIVDCEDGGEIQYLVRVREERSMVRGQRRVEDRKASGTKIIKSSVLLSGLSCPSLNNIIS
jgi:hypothetical protein